MSQSHQKRSQPLSARDEGRGALDSCSKSSATDVSGIELCSSRADLRPTEQKPISLSPRREGRGSGVRGARGRLCAFVMSLIICLFLGGLSSAQDPKVPADAPQVHFE